VTLTDTVEFAELLDVLGYTPDEYVAVCHQVPGGRFETAVGTSAGAPVFVNGLPTNADVWFGVCPVRGPARTRSGKGKASDVTRLSALFCDLDAYGTGPGDLVAAQAIIDDLSAHLEVRPSVIVNSGHGLHPYWPIEPEAARSLSNTDAAALLARFGRLVKTIASHHSCTVDNVFNLDRILRVPGTFNQKVMP
jgi:hypothetical protein